jgi:hypothetical protein
MKQFRVIEHAFVHSDTNLTSTPVAELHAGDEVVIREVLKVSGVSWCAVTIPDGRVGYAAPPFKGIVIRPVTLAQSSVDVFESPGSKVTATYISGDKFTITGVVTRGETQWVEIRTNSGEVAFISAGTKIKEIADPAEQRDKTFINTCAYAGGGIFLVLNLLFGSRNGFVGGAMGGALGAVLGTIVGSAIVAIPKRYPPNRSAGALGYSRQAQQATQSPEPPIRISVRSMKGNVSKVGSKYRFQVRVEGYNGGSCGLGWSGVTINVPTIKSREQYSPSEIQMSTIGCNAPFQNGPGDTILGFRDDGSFGEKKATCLFMECVREEWPPGEPIALEAVLLVPNSTLDFQVRVWSNRPENGGAFGDPDWRATERQKDQQGIPAHPLSLKFGPWDEIKNALWRRRLALLIVAAVGFAITGKLTVDKVAASKLAEARERAREAVAGDTNTIDMLRTQLALDRREVARLADAVVPMKREMYVERPIRVGDTFAGMVGENGFIGGPFPIRTVPDRKAASEIAEARHQAAIKLSEDEVWYKETTDKLAKDTAAANKLATAVAHWQDAFGQMKQ